MTGRTYIEVLTKYHALRENGFTVCGVLMKATDSSGQQRVVRESGEFDTGDRRSCASCVRLVKDGAHV